MKGKRTRLTIVAIVFLAGLGGLTYFLMDTSRTAAELPAAEKEAKQSGVPVKVAEMFPGKAVDEAENAAPLLAQAVRELDQAQVGDFADVIDGTATLSVAQTEMDKVAPALDLARKAADLSWFENPVDWDQGVKADFSQTLKVQSVVRLLCASGVLSAQKGHAEESVKDLVAARKVVKLMSVEPSLACASAAFECDGLVFKAVDQAMKAMRTNIMGLTFIQEEILLKPLRITWVRTMRGEAYLGTATIRNLDKLGGLGRVLSGTAEAVSDPKREGSPTGTAERAYLTRHYQLWSKILGMAMMNSDDDVVLLQHVSGIIRKAADDKRSSNALEPFLDKGWLHTTDMVLANRARALVGWSLCRILAFYSQKGHFPKGLDELGDVPLDPFDAKPIRFRATSDTVTVWSVGPNRKDDNGTPMPQGTSREIGVYPQGDISVSFKAP